MLPNSVKFLIDYSSEVRQAIDKTPKKIVALESTIISHGMPYPRNLETATQVEDIIRAQGAVPATIAILHGRIKIGLSRAEMEELAEPSNEVIKVSTRDIAYVIAREQTGATTVAATSLIASWVGIRVFVTGGVGGVHRDYNETMDVSNDLVELGRIQVCVVSAGIKSILDIGKSLEYLETEGVLVMGYKTNDFPAFFSPKSGFKCYRGENDQLIAKTLATHFDTLALERGILLAVPVELDDLSSPQRIEEKTTQALKEAKEKNVSGKEITPFLLARIAELTGKDSLEMNIKLIKNNALVGARVAIAYSHVSP
jgi:pseudouridine-5'-phosphate glycosidase